MFELMSGLLLTFWFCMFVCLPKYSLEMIEIFSGSNTLKVEIKKMLGNVRN